VIDLKVIRDNPDAARASQKVRGEDPTLIDQVIAADDARRAALSSFESLRAEQNLLSKSVAAAKGDEKAPLLEKAKALSAQVKAAEAQASELAEKSQAILLQIHNLIDTDAPVGGEEDFKIIEHVGTPRDFTTEGFEARDHVEIGKILKAIDTERGAKVSGSRFYYLTGMVLSLSSRSLTMQSHLQRKLASLQ